MRAAEPTPEDLSSSPLFLLRRDDGDGRDDVSGSGGGVKNTVTIVTTVTEPKTYLRPRGAIRRLYREMRRKYQRFPPHLDGGMLSKAEPLALPYLQCGCHMQTRQRLPDTEPQRGVSEANRRRRHFGRRRSRKLTPCPQAAHGTLQPAGMKVS